MADNYLERRMEEYRSRQGAGSRVSHAHPLSSRLKPGQALIEYPAVRVLVTDGTSEAGRAVIDTFRRLNCRVAFTASDGREGAMLAQCTGAQYHPGTGREALARLADAGDPAGVIINLAGEPDVVSTVELPVGADPQTLAAWCAFRAHPAGRMLNVAVLSNR